MNWDWIAFCLQDKAVQLKDPSGVPTYVKRIKRRRTDTEIEINVCIC